MPLRTANLVPLAAHPALAARPDGRISFECNQLTSRLPQIVARFVRTFGTSRLRLDGSDVGAKVREKNVRLLVGIARHFWADGVARFSSVATTARDTTHASGIGKQTRRKPTAQTLQTRILILAHSVRHLWEVVCVSCVR